MRRLTPDELRFLIWFGVSQLSRALLRDMLSADSSKREAAVKIAAASLVERFTAHEVLAPDPAKPH